MEGVGGSTLLYSIVCMYVHTDTHTYNTCIECTKQIVGSIHCAFTSTYIARYSGRSSMGKKLE